MEIKKATEVIRSGSPTAAQLEAINAQARATLTGEQVYVFSLRLCDDQIDRDYERFDTGALPELAKLFIGKTEIFHMGGQRSEIIRRISEPETLYCGKAQFSVFGKTVYVVPLSHSNHCSTPFSLKFPQWEYRQRW